PARGAEIAQAAEEPMERRGNLLTNALATTAGECLRCLVRDLGGARAGGLPAQNGHRIREPPCTRKAGGLHHVDLRSCVHGSRSCVGWTVAAARALPVPVGTD